MAGSEIIVSNSTFTHAVASKQVLKLSASNMLVQDNTYFKNYRNTKGGSFPLIDISQNSKVQAKDLHFL